MEVDGMKLRELREDRTLSARELAEAAGVHYNTVLRLENNQGGAQPRTLRKLAKALGVEPRELRDR
jgi:HTH-type transcriptional regulator, competence development regulator